MKNKKFTALEPLIGQWEYTMYNCWFLESMDTKIKGSTTIEWLYDTFLTIRTIKADKKPSDIWVIGYSDAQQKYQMFYHDQRGVARIFNMTFDGKTIIFLREDEDFYQRITIKIETSRLHSIAEASKDKGKTWRKDLEMSLVKI
ncbi:MAG: hypothetical protein ROY99_03300 [Ignavibacterium sp.]|jgi:hypothetical protein|nr:hypothetical protein [Ignavibacterium sp.]